MTQASNAPVTRPHSDVPSKDDPTLGRLFADASRDMSTLVRQEIALAKSELKISVKAGGVGVGLFAGAAFLVNRRWPTAVSAARRGDREQGPDQGQGQESGQDQDRSQDSDSGREKEQEQGQGPGPAKETGEKTEAGK